MPLSRTCLRTRSVKESGSSHAGAEEHFENRSIPKAQRLLRVRRHEDALDLGHREHVRGQAPLPSRQIEIRRGVPEDDVVLREPPEEASNRDEPPMLRAVGERPSVRLAIVEHEALVAFEDRPRDLFGSSVRPRLSPS